MTLAPGSTVELNGKRLTIRSIHAAGAHRNFIFQDGSNALDVDKAVASGKAKLISSLGSHEVKEEPVAAPTGVLGTALKKLFDGKTAPPVED